MASSELEASNLARALDRLRIYTKSLEEELDKVHSGRHRSVATSSVHDKADQGVTDAEFKFIRTCQALRAVLSHFNIVVQLDPGERRILDKSKRRNNVIAAKETAGPFFEWLANIPGALTGSLIARVARPDA